MSIAASTRGSAPMNQPPPCDTSGASSANEMPITSDTMMARSRTACSSVGVAASERLRDQARRSGAQEVEGRKDDVENDRASRQPAQQRGVAEMADHGRVDEADQRRRQIGKRHRHGDRQYGAIVDDEVAI